VRFAMRKGIRAALAHVADTWNLEAIADAMALGNQINGHAACLTKVSPFGIRAAFKKYVTSHPEDPPKLPATELVARAISEAFPCQ